MIILKNIVTYDEFVKCDIYPEDSQEAGFIEINFQNEEIMNFSLPLGYEWCKSHIQHVKNYILKNKDNLPKEKLLIWC